MRFLALFLLAAAAFAQDAANGNLKLIPTLWTQTAPEWRGLCEQAYHVARGAFDRALKDKRSTAALEQKGNFSKLPPAIVLDIDETVLDNIPGQARQVRNGTGFVLDTFNKWVMEAKAEPIPGAVQFCQYAASKKVRVFFVTNREASQETATRGNLKRHGFPLADDEDTVLCRGEKPNWTSDKGTRRAEIATKYRILMLVGDDLGDFMPGIRVSYTRRLELARPFAANWGTKWIILPNPSYGSWEQMLLEEKKPLVNFVDTKE
ncbi:MAG: HAD family acid phosphatase [Bryobacteraceae bacterium]